MNYITEQKLKEFEVMAELRKLQIRNTEDELCIKGTKYYVSNNGCDDNDGLTKETPVKSIEKINSLELKVGDGVFFKRGDIF